jgi:outer membrane protein OmpA-like peptidoglycan-associated protein
MKYRLLNLILIVCFFISHKATISQNLIPNAGFEYHRNCPITYGQVALSTGWRNPTKGTPDYYHPCGIEDYQTPKNRYGYKTPFAGSAYIGLNSRLTYREYVKTKLKEPLKAGVTYEATIYVSSSAKFDYITSDIGFYFSNENISQSNYKIFKDIVPQVVNSQDNFIQPDKWQKISGKFIAKGGEIYVTIGSFGKSIKTFCINKNIDATKPSSGDENTYTYIDNFSTIPLDQPKYKLPAKGKIKLLDHVYFQLNKANLLTASHNELNKLATILKDNSEIKIIIIGHTDDSGNEDYNIKLSEKRAQAVANYLMKKGISKLRVQYKGLGSKFPMVKNESDKDRQLNRRVEFKIVD